MRISRIRIGSFGGVRDRDYRMGEGMTVLYGPNESGKTSTMEFVRSVLVPSNRKKLYPTRRKTDSGILDIVGDDGLPAALELSYRDVEGPTPPCVADMDPDLYREIFAMDPGTLDMDESITGGDIKSRFLTIPGGEGMPSAIEGIEAEIKEVIGLKSNSRSRLRAIEADITTTADRIRDKRSRADEYGALAGRLGELEAELESLKGASSADTDARDLFKRYESNRANYDTLSTLRDQRSSLGPFTPVTEADIAERDRLRGECMASDGRLRSVEDQQTRAKEALGGADPRVVTRHADEIRSLSGRLDAYASDVSRLAASSSQSRDARAGGRRAVLAMGIALVAIGLVLGVAVSIYAAAVSVAGVVAIAAGLRHTPAPAVDPKAEARARVSEFEARVSRLSSELGLRPADAATALRMMEGLSAAAAEYNRCSVPYLKARSDSSAANEAMAVFYSRFGGEDGFERSRALTARAAELDARISTVRSAIEGAGLDPDQPECPVAWEDTGIQDRMGEINREIGETRRGMSAILDMRDLEADMDELSRLEAERGDILDEGAVALLARHIAGMACDAAYRGVQPGVVASADRYLKSMTGDGCSIALDPSTNDISLVSGDGVRSSGEWSSGLRAQVLLSLKLAVAREMGGGLIPVILDDVLLPFDSERKAGAVRALAGISGEMQVLLFTCDAETRAIAESEEGVTVLRM